MKVFRFIILTGLSLASCTRQSPPGNQEATTDSVSSLSTATDSSITLRQQRPGNENPAGKDGDNSSALVLSINELRYVDKTNGSSREIPFGTSEGQLVSIVNRLLNLKQPKIGINSECGSGPLKMASWSNGLTVMFKENKKTGTWEFVGWSMGSGSVKVPEMTTMSNIGIGSTRAELEEAYSIKTEKTSLGYEFSTINGGLYGILSGPGKNAMIRRLWSGTSCVFR